MHHHLPSLSIANDHYAMKFVATLNLSVELNDDNSIQSELCSNGPPSLREIAFHHPIPLRPKKKLEEHILQGLDRLRESASHYTQRNLC